MRKQVAYKCKVEIYCGGVTSTLELVGTSEPELRHISLKLCEYIEYISRTFLHRSILVNNGQLHLSILQELHKQPYKYVCVMEQNYNTIRTQYRVYTKLI